MEWISVKDDMPKEEDSVFARCYGTTRWTKGMFRKVSKKVLVTLEKGNGQRETITGRTEDGEWVMDIRMLKGKVTHWMPFPEPAKGE